MTEVMDDSDGPPDLDCYCSLNPVLELLSARHAMQIVCVVGALEPVRYGEIEASFATVSSSTLSKRLAELTDADVLVRRQYDEIPPRVEYELTDAGGELCDRLEPVLDWVDAYDAADRTDS